MYHKIRFCLRIIWNYTLNPGMMCSFGCKWAELPAFGGKGQINAATSNNSIHGYACPISSYLNLPFLLLLMNTVKCNQV